MSLPNLDKTFFLGGGAVDPFTAMQHSNEGGLFASAAAKDKEYQSLLG